MSGGYKYSRLLLLYSNALYLSRWGTLVGRQCEDISHTVNVVNFAVQLIPGIHAMGIS